MAPQIALFRENPDRALFLTGPIGQPLLDRLTPEILRLQNSSNAPITVYIDSLGGSTFHARPLVELMKKRNQDGKRCRIITVVTGVAASAAADILSAGDYAIAYDHAVIHFHGVRTDRGEITHESASFLAEALRQSNENFALNLAQSVLSRFLFIYLQISQQIVDLQANDSQMTDVESFATCLSSKLLTSTSILDLATAKHKRLKNLLDYYAGRQPEQALKGARKAEREAFLLKCLIDWELEKNSDKDWAFSSEGLDVMREDFILLSDYEEGQHMANFEQNIRQWGGFFLNDEQRAHYDALPEDDQTPYILEATRDRFRPIWHFLVSLCRALQQGENRITARDAYWLGLIDEIPGSKLPNVREVVERQQELASPSSTVTKTAKKRSKPISAAKNTIRTVRKSAAKKTTRKPK